MKLIKEMTNDVNVVQESLDEQKEKSYFIEGIFLQGKIKNRNGRIYPPEILEKEVNRYNEQYIAENRAYGELGHPDNPSINLDRVSHIIKELRREDNNFIGKAKIIDSPSGKIVKNLLDEGAKIGVSSRGLGSLKKNNIGENIVQDDFHIVTAADIVADPSAPQAFVQGIMENKEWVYENGMFKEVDLENEKKKIDEAAGKKDRNELDRQILESWYRLLSKF